MITIAPDSPFSDVTVAELLALKGKNVSVIAADLKKDADLFKESQKGKKPDGGWRLAMRVPEDIYFHSKDNYNNRDVDPDAFAASLWDDFPAFRMMHDRGNPLGKVNKHYGPWTHRG